MTANVSLVIAAAEHTGPWISPLVDMSAAESIPAASKGAQDRYHSASSMLSFH